MDILELKYKYIDKLEKFRYNKRTFEMRNSYKLQLSSLYRVYMYPRSTYRFGGIDWNHEKNSNNPFLLLIKKISKYEIMQK